MDSKEHCAVRATCSGFAGAVGMHECLVLAVRSSSPYRCEIRPDGEVTALP